LLTTSAALSVYGNVKLDVGAYQASVATSAADQSVLVSLNQELTAAASDVSGAQDTLAAARSALRRFAVDEYVSSGLYVSSSLTNVGSPTPFGPQNADGVAAHQYESVAANDLLSKYQAATTHLAASLSHRDAATRALAQANATLTSDTAAQNRALARLVNDVTTLQTAGACTTVQITSPTPTGPTVPTTTVHTPTTAVPSTTTTTTTVPPTTVPTVIGAVVPTTVAPATTVPTTAPPTTSTSTTTTVPPTTTSTSTTVPGTPTTQAPAAPNPAGLGQLQGCIAVFTPPGS
jgi:hypothetical protein